MMRRDTWRRGGFTLLEVMIAVVILAVGLSSLFTSEAGAIRIAQRARTTAVASLLARCKMGEIEEEIAKKGWPATNMDGRDGCCEDAEHDGYVCDWKVERIVLPDLTEDMNRSVLDRLKDTTGSGSTETENKDPSATPTPETSTSAVQNLGIPLSGLGGFGAGGGDPLASLVMEMAFPLLKPIVEEQVRRATVSVQWLEGTSSQSFEVVQFLVNELPMLVETVDEENETGTGPAGSGTGAPTPGTSTGGSGSGGGGTGSGGPNTGSGGRR